MWIDGNTGYKAQIVRGELKAIIHREDGGRWKTLWSYGDNVKTLNRIIKRLERVDPGMYSKISEYYTIDDSPVNTALYDMMNKPGLFVVEVEQDELLVTIEVTNTETNQVGTLTCGPNQEEVDNQILKLKKTMVHG